MFRRSLFRGAAVLTVLTIPYCRTAAAFSDIPGEGKLRCFPAVACADSPGVVTSTPPGLITGSLSGAPAELHVSLTGSPLFLTFSGAETVLGPLGRNPAYNPESNRDSRIPVSGRPIELELTNSTGNVISDVTLYLEIPMDVVTGPFTGQPDGVSFGTWCNTGFAEPRHCAEHLALLSIPTGPGVLNPADITPNVGPNPTFGDLLRFRHVDLGPGEAARFTFFITDRKATLDPSTGGSVAGASNSFNLEIVATPVPEPATLLISCAALLAVFCSRYARARVN